MKIGYKAIEDDDAIRELTGFPKEVIDILDERIEKLVIEKEGL